MSVGGCVSRLYAEMIEIDENDKIETVDLDVVGFVWVVLEVQVGVQYLRYS